MPNPKPSFPQTFEAGLYHKPSYLSNHHMQGLGIISYSLWFVKPICCIKKSPKTREKLSIIVIFFYKTNIKYLRNQDKRFVIYHRVNCVYF
jgi:hypothetical protein